MCMLSFYIYLSYLFFQLHDVSRMVQGRRREPSVKTFPSALSAEFAKLNAAACLDSRAKKWKY